MVFAGNSVSSTSYNWLVMTYQQYGRCKTEIQSIKSLMGQYPSRPLSVGLLYGGSESRVNGVKQHIRLVQGSSAVRGS